MRYMMFVCTDTDTESDTDRSNEPDIEVWVAENDANGRQVDGSALAPTSAATTVRPTSMSRGTRPRWSTKPSTY